LDRGDYVFAGAVVTCISVLFLAVSTYEIPFYAMEVNVQIFAAIATAVGLILVAYGYVAKTASQP
jgi:hypothetical protein